MAFHSPEETASRAWYGSTIAVFLTASNNEVLGELVRHSEFSVDEAQKAAWLEEIAILKANLEGVSGSVFLEFNIPRMGSRVDVVLVVGPVVFVVEFKVGQRTFDRSAIEQVWDYALDLKNFHEGSHQVAIVPILVATEADECGQLSANVDRDGVYRPLKVTASEFRNVLNSTLHTVSGAQIDAASWERKPYKPTPTIVEAARALYAQHKVKAISCFDAGRQNLGRTSKRIETILEEAKANQRKVICFVTGVPGAGKTLVGLNVATQHRQEGEPTHAVLLSGNGPLVAVLRAALSRDEKARLKAAGKKRPKGSDPVKQFIQNVHHSTFQYLRSVGIPEL